MFKSKIILLFILINIPLFSQDFPLNYERLSVDFNGVTYNGKSIICYGTGGIILRSTDFGENWTQKQIAHDVYTVIKIVHYENSYYGILDSNYFVYSVNDGLNWEKIKFEDGLDFIDIYSDTDGIYLLTENEILLIDFNFNILNRISIANPDKLQRLIISNDFLLLCDSKNMLNIYNKQDLKFEQSADLKEYLNEPVASGFLKFIKNGASIYLKTGNEIIKSSDDGITWENLLSDSSIYTLNRDKIYLLNSTSDKSKNNSSLIFKIYSNNELDTVSYESANKLYVSRQIYTEMQFLNEDTLISVGFDKLINISYDGGKNWKLLSNLRIVRSTQCNWLNDNIGYLCTEKYQIFRTVNSGTTWLPQDSNYQNKGELTFPGPEAWYIDDDGTQFIFSRVFFNHTDNILVSKDYGKSYEVKFDSVPYGYKWDFPPFIVKNDSTYLLFHCIKDISTMGLTLMVEYDQKINPVRKWLIDSMSILFAFNSEDKKKLIGIGLDRTYSNRDSISLIASIDGGKTWNRDFKFLINYNFINKISLLDDIIIVSSYVYDTLHKGTNFARVDFLDYKQKKLFPLVMNDTFVVYDIFPLENTLFATTYQGKIFSNPYYKTDFYKWISNDISSLKSIMEDFSNNKVAYGPGAYNNKNNYLYKLTKNNINYVEEAEIDVPPVYFFTMKPYPLPAKDIIKCHIFTTMDFNPMEPDVFVYDLFGKKVSSQGDISMSRFSNWEWDLQWDCSKIQSGIYIIVLKEGSISRSIRVVVER